MAGFSSPLAAAFERGEINAFEFSDGHTYPPGLEIADQPDAPNAENAA